MHFAYEKSVFKIRPSATINAVGVSVYLIDWQIRVGPCRDRGSLT